MQLQERRSTRIVLHDMVKVIGTGIAIWFSERSCCLHHADSHNHLGSCDMPISNIISVPGLGGMFTRGCRRTFTRSRACGLPDWRVFDLGCAICASKIMDSVDTGQCHLQSASYI